MFEQRDGFPYQGLMAQQQSSPYNYVLHRRMMELAVQTLTNITAREPEVKKPNLLLLLEDI